MKPFRHQVDCHQNICRNFTKDHQMFCACTCIPIEEPTEEMSSTPPPTQNAPALSEATGTEDKCSIHTNEEVFSGECNCNESPQPPEIEEWEKKLLRYRKEFLIESNPDDYIHIGLNGGCHYSDLISDVRSLLARTREEGYNEGAHEATMVCNEKTIPFALREMAEKMVGREIVTICFCGELKNEIDAHGYCECGAFTPNRRGFALDEEGKLDGFNAHRSQCIAVAKEYGVEIN